MKYLRHIITILLFVMGTIIPAESTPPEQTEKLKVVASFSILGDLIRQVGKDLVDVRIIVPENADPHVYRPNPKDAKLLAQADLIITNGLGFEGWLDRLIENSGYKGSIIVATKNVIPRLLSPEPKTNLKTEAAKDPHAWHSVSNAILYVEVIAEALKEALPDNKCTIEKNKETYINQLKELDTWIRQTYSTLPSSKRYVVTTHDAFWYYGEAYAVHFLAPVGISTDAEPAAAAVAKLIKEIQKKKIRAVFIENLSSGKLLGEIADEANVTLGGTLYADSLSEPASSSGNPSPAATYIDMIRYNTTEIIKALKN